MGQELVFDNERIGRQIEQDRSKRTSCPFYTGSERRESVTFERDFEEIRLQPGRQHGR